MSNNTPETMPKQGRYSEENKVKYIEKGKRYYKENRERLQKWPMTNIKDYLKKIRKGNTQEIDTSIYLKKTSKN